MNPETLKRIETAIVLFLLVTADSLSSALPGNLPALVKILSYPLIFFLIIRQPLGTFFNIAGRDILLVVFLLFATASWFWSNEQSATLNELKSLPRVAFFGIYLAMRYDRRELMRMMAWMLGISAIVSLFYCVLVPSIGKGTTNNVSVWQGIYGQKQYLARAMVMGAMTFALSAISDPKRRWIYLGLFSLALLLIFMSTSRSGMALVVVSLLLIPCLKVLNLHFKVRTGILIIVGAIVGFAAVMVFTNLETIVVDIMGKNLEFNGRTPLWERVIEIGMQRPWFGYGYSGFWSAPVSYEVSRYLWITSELGSSHAHNGLIDIFLQLGLVGLSLFLIHFLILLVRLIRQLFVEQSTENFWMLQVVITGFLYNLIELNTILSTNFLWIFYIAISISTCLPESRSQSSDTSNSLITPSSSHA